MTVRFRMPLTDLDMFPLTKALIKEVKDHRENPPKYKVGARWNCIYPVGKLVIGDVPKTPDGLYTYFVVTTLGDDPEIKLTIGESQIDKWIRTGTLLPYTDEFGTADEPIPDEPIQKQA